jgi:glucokinase
VTEQNLMDTALAPTAERVGVMARGGDKAALGAFERMGYWLGIALASLSNLLNIDKVVIGGGVAESYDLLLPPLVRNFEQRCFRQIYERVVIEKARLGDDAGLLGGAALAVANLEQP